MGYYSIVVWVLVISNFKILITFSLEYIQRIDNIRRKFMLVTPLELKA